MIFMQSGMQRLDGEGGGVGFACGKPIKGVRDVLACEACGLVNRHAFEHLCECGAAGERGRTTVSEKARRFDEIAVDP